MAKPNPFLSNPTPVADPAAAPEAGRKAGRPRGSSKGPVQRTTINFPGELYDRMNAARGHLTMTSWILLAAEEKLKRDIV